MKTTFATTLDNALKVRLLMTVFLTGLLFTLLAIIIQYPVVTDWETDLLWQIYQIHNPTLNTLNLALDYIGSLPAMLVVTLLVSVVAFFRKRPDYSWFVWLAFLGAALLGWLGKVIFSRSRPDVWEQFTPFFGDSFPSNHSLYAITLAGIFLVIFFNTAWRNVVLLCGTLWSISMGLSRFYLGAHFPTDVLAGWSLGIAWLGLLCWCFIHFNLFRSNPFQHRASSFAGNHEV